MLGIPLSQMMTFFPAIIFTSKVGGFSCWTAAIFMMIHKYFSGVQIYLCCAPSVWMIEASSKAQNCEQPSSGSLEDGVVCSQVRLQCPLKGDLLFPLFILLLTQYVAGSRSEPESTWTDNYKSSTGAFPIWQPLNILFLLGLKWLTHRSILVSSPVPLRLIWF